MSQINLYTSRETDKKVEDIKKKKKDFVPSQFYREKVDELYKETFEADLELLKKKELTILEKEKQMAEEKKLLQEKIKEAEKNEPERIKIKEESTILEEKKKQREVIKYNILFSDTLKVVLKYFEIEKEEAEELVKEFLSSTEFKKRKMGIKEYAVKYGCKLNKDILRDIKSDLKNPNYADFQEFGYKFDFIK